MISLRARLLLGYAYLVMLLLVTAGSASLGLIALSGGVARVLQDNVRSLDASAKMIDALTRETLETRAPEPDATRLDAAQRDFKRALEQARGNITIEAERPVLDALAQAHGRYREAPKPSVTADLALVQASARALELLELNQQAIIAAEVEARASAKRQGAWLGLLATIALLSLLWLARALQRGLLSRLAEMREALSAREAGDTTLRLPVGARDELGVIAAQLNAAMDKTQQLHGQLLGLSAHQRQLLAALLEAAHARPATILNMAGVVIVSTMSDEALAALEAAEVGAWVREQGAEAMRERQEGQPCVITREPYQARLLVARGVRVVGWLVM